MICGLTVALVLTLNLSAAAVSGEPSVVKVKPQLLSEKTFKPFGQVIKVPEGHPPTSRDAVTTYWRGLAKTRIHKNIEFGLLRAKARVHEVAEMMRHRWSPELLVSLEGDFYLVVAPYARPKGGKLRPVAAQVRVFLVKRGQAVVLHKGTWHALPFPVAGECLFLVAFRDGTKLRGEHPRAFRERGAIVTF